MSLLLPQIVANIYKSQNKSSNGFIGSDYITYAILIHVW